MQLSESPRVFFVPGSASRWATLGENVKAASVSAKRRISSHVRWRQITRKVRAQADAALRIEGTLDTQEWLAGEGAVLFGGT